MDENENSIKGDAIKRLLYGQTHEGIHYPVFLPSAAREHLNNVRNTSYQEGDTLVCAYPKSGTHWVLEIVSMLKRRRATPTAAYTFLDIIPTSALDGIPNPRVFATHFRFNQLPADFLKHNAKIIYVLRNPKDLAVSLYTFSKNSRDLAYDGTWEEFLNSFIKGEVSYSSWFSHVRSWEQDKKDNPEYPILFVYYEDIKQNPEREIRRIASHLGVKDDEQLFESIVEKTRIEKMQCGQPRYYLVPPEYMDPNHRQNLFRKGKVGDWKQSFSRQQLQEFDNLYRDKMKDSQLSFKYQILM